MRFHIQHIQSFSKPGKRTHNEDCIYPFLDKNAQEFGLDFAENLYMICDGVGGLNKGEIASELACKRFAHYFYESEPNENEALSPLYMQHAVKWVESGFDAYLRENLDCAGMGTTVALLYFNEIGANIAWIGDSRVYHIRSGKIQYQTQDHSLVNELIKLGQITPEQARTHRQKNVILRAIQGSSIPTEAEVYCIPWSEIQKGDYFLLCSDGITETWQNPDLEEVFAHGLPNPQIVEYLDKACELNSRDNYSCSIIEIGEEILAPVITPTVAHTIIESTPVVEIPQVEVESISPVIETQVPPIEENFSSALPVVEAPKEENLPLVSPELPKVETPITVAPTKEIPPKEIPLVETPPPPIPTLEVSQIPTENKGGRTWLWVLIAAIIIVGSACAWMYIELYGEGAKNELFENYYKVAAEKVKYCEETGKCAEAKGAKNQAKVAAETMEEHRLVDSLDARISRKEEEVRRKSTINSPKELTDKDKEDTRAEGTPKSQTPTPKSPQNVAPTKATTSTTATTKPVTSPKTTTTVATTTSPTTATKETPVAPKKPETKPANMPIPATTVIPKTTSTVKPK